MLNASTAATNLEAFVLVIPNPEWPETSNDFERLPVCIFKQVMPTFEKQQLILAIVV